MSARRYAAEGPSKRILFVFAHGAGAGQTHPFMTAYARGLAASGVDVVTFNFPYMDAGRRVPDKAPVLDGAFRECVAEWRRDPAMTDHVLFIGGKSMGGRMATHLASQGLEGLRGVVALGYPLHPPGKPEQLRVSHLPHVSVPLLIVQGERDAFGTPTELAPHIRNVEGHATIHVVQGGDHSLAVKGRNPEDIRADVLGVLLAWFSDTVAS